MTKHFYYTSSTSFFTVLKPNSWVTKYKEDAIYLTIPWLLYHGQPQASAAEVPEDNNIYIYKIETDSVIKIEDCGERFRNWNWQTTDWAKVELIQYYPSWHKFFGLFNVNKQILSDIEFENIPNL